MGYYQNLICDDEARRVELREHETLNGIDYIEVVTEPPADNQKILKVYFISKTTSAGKNNLSKMLNDLDGNVKKVTIHGGVRVKQIKVVEVKKNKDYLKVRVDTPGDFSTYTLRIDHVWKPDDEKIQPPPPRLDPAYAQCDFSFKAGCPSVFDCKSRRVYPAQEHFEPLIDYMAKDYASFRQALIDLIPALVSEWKERHEADLGMALAELLAYMGDNLSYYQDAVANEAYLETARQRISVRRHVRLIDYNMHDGVSARAFIHINLKENYPGKLGAGTQFLSRIDVPLGSGQPPHGPVISYEIAHQALKESGSVFEAMMEASLDFSLNEIKLYAWGNKQCCLPRGLTAVDLKNDLTAHLSPGDFLLFEEIKGPETGLKSDADPKHRQVVRLTKVEKKKDPLENLDITRITWDTADRLMFPLCLSARLTKGLKKGAYEPDISVARGNLILADHGHTILAEEHSGPQTPKYTSLSRAHRIRLKEGPLSFRTPMPKGEDSVKAVAELIKTDPGKVKPEVTRMQVTGTVPSDDWEAVSHLLDSSPFNHHFVVETDNDGRALIRFGNDRFGMAPPEGSKIKVNYRVGVVVRGNVGPESLKHVIKPVAAANWPDIVDIRNPMPAWGGTDPQPIEQVKQLAPAAFHSEILRAVTEADYANAAEKHPEVSKAVATFRWTGSWHTVFITIDPKGRTDLPPELKQRIKDWVTRYTMAGYDLKITPPIFVPLEIEIVVCVAHDHFRAHVEEALLMALSNQILPDGARGFFHPDNFTFGQPLYLSMLYAGIESVEGVDSAIVNKFQKFGKLADNELEQGYIPMDRLEIIRLDNDPNFPENGSLKLNMLAGK